MPARERWAVHALPVEERLASHAAASHTATAHAANSQAATAQSARARLAARVAVALLLVASAVASTAHAADSPPAPRSGDWSFRVSLDGEPIGEHRFRLEREGDGDIVRLTSEARFDVRLLGLTVYRYRHSALERWRGDCLASLAASTDDDGTPSRVALPAIDGCVMSFAYWHPALRMQTRLLNAQTGQVERVQVERLPDARIDVRGEPVAAHGYRIVGTSRPVDVWYGADERWIGLDAVVGEKRRLSYRLR